jgi:hypothetical protein
MSEVLFSFNFLTTEAAVDCISRTRANPNYALSYWRERRGVRAEVLRKQIFRARHDQLPLAKASLIAQSLLT